MFCVTADAGRRVGIADPEQGTVNPTVVLCHDACVAAAAGLDHVIAMHGARRVMHLLDLVRRIFDGRTTVIDYALLAMVLVFVAAVLLFRHRKRALAACEDPRHSADVTRHPIRSMKRKWTGRKWIRVCLACWERRREEDTDL